MENATASRGSRKEGDTAERARVGIVVDGDRYLFTVTLTACGTLICRTSRADVAHRMAAELNRHHGR